MRIRTYLAVVAFFALVSLSNNVQAVMHRVDFNAWTQNDPSGQVVVVKVDAFDDEYAYPPEFLKSIKITAPNGTITNLDLSKDWKPFDGFFTRGLPTTTLGASGGTYKVTVTPMTGSAIVETDAVAKSFLPIPVLTYPTNGLTGVVQTPTITWNAVSGASYYKILLLNTSFREPVYATSFRIKTTDFTSYQLPIGTLKPNCDYSIMIEARAASQDLDKRSRTAWVNFRTGSW